MNLREAELHHTSNLPVPWMEVAVAVGKRCEVGNSFKFAAENGLGEVLF